MNPKFDILWWISVIELPALASLFLFMWRNNKETEDELENIRIQIEKESSKSRDRLASFKLDVAKDYTSITYMKDVEKRITSHLIRIEEKLEGVRCHEL